MPDQRILDEGPGLRARKRETDAVLDTVSPPAAAPKKTAPPSKVDKVKTGPYGSKPGEKRIDVGDMVKPLGAIPSYKKGTAYVPKTGPAMLHEGEAVVPAKDNPMKSIYDKITGGDKPKKALKSIHTRKAKDGSFIHEHHFHHTSHKMEEHTSPDMKSALDHMSEHAPTMQPDQPAEPQPQPQAGTAGQPTPGAAAQE